MGKIVIGKILGLSTNWMLVAVIAIRGLAAVVGAASQAIWTDSDAVGTNDFATGSVSLATTPTSTIWTPVTAAALSRRSAIPGIRAHLRVTPRRPQETGTAWRAALADLPAARARLTLSSHV